MGQSSYSGSAMADEWPGEERPEIRLLLQQLQLMWQIMPEMHLLASEIYHQLSEPDGQ